MRRLAGHHARRHPATRSRTRLRGVRAALRSRTGARRAGSLPHPFAARHCTSRSSGRSSDRIGDAGQRDRSDSCGIRRARRARVWVVRLVRFILESIVTTVAADGAVNVAPMGVEWGDQVIVLKPFLETTTYRNVMATQSAVVNLQDDVRVFARAAISNPQYATEPASVVRGVVLA